MIKQVIKRIKNKLFNDSINSEHILAMFGVVSIILPLFTNLTFIWVLRKIKSSSIQTNSAILSILLQLFHELMMIVFAIVFGYIFYQMMKLLFNLLKRIRIILSLSLFTTLLVYLCFALSWLTLFLANLVYFFDPTKEHFFLIFQTSQLMIKLILGITNNLINYLVWIYLLWFSMFFNNFVPLKYQKINLSIRDKLIRLFIKLACLSGISGFILMINFINKENFWITGILSAIVAVIPTFLKFVDPNDYLKSRLSKDSLKLLPLFPLFAAYLFIAWNISANLFDTYMPGKFYLLCAIFITLSSVTLFMKIGIERLSNKEEEKLLHKKHR